MIDSAKNHRAAVGTVAVKGLPHADKPGQSNKSAAVESELLPANEESWPAQRSLGVTWITMGMMSYITLSLALRWLHSPAAVADWQRTMPSNVYERSLAMFTTAFAIDVLAALFELKTSRLDMVLLPAFIKGTATVTNTLVRYGYATVALAPNGTFVMLQRYICWMHTTPTLLLLIKLMSSSLTNRDAAMAVACVETMIVAGAGAALTSGATSLVLAIISHIAFFPLLPYVHRGLTEASAVISKRAANPALVTLVNHAMLLMWITFGVVFDLHLAGMISTKITEIVTVCCDFSAKVVFSGGLMLGSFTNLDRRREEAMRNIQETHRQTLVGELQHVIQQKDSFMSSIGHELRTPLNGIIGVSEGLLSGSCGQLSEAVRHQVYIMRASGARLLMLINNVMDATALRRTKAALNYERVDLWQVVANVADLTRSSVDADVALTNNVPRGLEVWADSGRVVQVLNNLLSNAAKFTHAGCIRVSANWVDAERQWVAVHVLDSGIGIPKSKLASIFLAFEQMDGNIRRQYGGLGLGLSIAQELVRAHGGELSVRSDEGRGSCFTFTLPAFKGQTAGGSSAAQQISALPHTDPSAPSFVGDALFAAELPYDAAQLSALASAWNLSSGDRNQVRSAGRRAGAAAAGGAAAAATEVSEGAVDGKQADVDGTEVPAGSKGLLLGVSDDQLDHVMLQGMLTSQGFRYQRAMTGAAALAALNDGGAVPQLVLLDAALPDADGLEVLRQLRSRHSKQDLPVIMLTGRNNENVIGAALDAGASDYCLKPLRRGEVEARINMHLRGASDNNTGSGDAEDAGTDDSAAAGSTADGEGGKEGSGAAVAHLLRRRPRKQ